MKVLIIGNGGREHALAWRAAKSPLAEKVYVAPGNPGTASEDKMENVNIAVNDIKGLVEFAKKENIGLTIVGPEAPLVEGVVDEFEKNGLKIFGPSKAGAQLEGSKSFTKHFLKRHNIPTAAYEVFTKADEAEAYIKKMGAPIVIKADGLAAGKGVVVAMTEAEAIEAVHSMLDEHQFGDASASVVIEEFMEGEEASFIVMSDTINALPMATSQDHKRVGDGDTGPNTGGMGAYSPAPVVTDEVYKRVMERIIYPTLKGMAEDGIPYRGFLYAGLMIDKAGNPRVVEFNCRFGDPETQPIMMRMQSDLVDLCLHACENDGLKGMDIKYDPRPAIGVVLAAENYPASPRKGDKISGLDHKTADDIKVFQAGTKQVDSDIVTSGGRVLCVTALGDDVAQARAKAYEHIKNIHFDGMFFRNDIAWRALNR
ncbi:phosphoribosylamine--glycine ligase [Succinivibrio dextrinosolvens]|uniref:phosphoribosylamine--glycine ligase n=1 Tax=Succinivibrio dextrinosolvens TaxID=83771 RepID=UPI00247A223C|nr:phosphoribosylamine--glycine ligase [Succinivibrio dextrinosolvens]